jgi:PIN domain nuclease of toxin-antitoxin system
VSAFVTDTHPLIWYTSGKHSRLSKRAVRFFDQAFAERALLVIPAPVLWEIALLIEHGKVKTAREPFEHWAASLTSRKGVDLVSLDLDVIAEAHRLTFHGDPFDRTIVATARLMNLPLITKDEIIVNSRLVEIAW